MPQFAVKKNSPGCNCCDEDDPTTQCSYCDTDTQSTMTLEFSGVANGVGCANCADFNSTTYELPYTTTGGESVCRWNIDDPESDCPSIDYLHIAWASMDVRWIVSVGSESILRSAAQSTSPIDCGDPAEFPVSAPYYWENAHVLRACSWSSATATIDLL